MLGQTVREDVERRDHLHFWHIIGQPFWQTDVWAQLINLFNCSVFCVEQSLTTPINLSVRSDGKELTACVPRIALRGANLVKDPPGTLTHSEINSTRPHRRSRVEAIDWHVALVSNSRTWHGSNHLPCAPPAALTSLADSTGWMLHSLKKQGVSVCLLCILFN